jgi:hypothetical protein
LAFELQSVKNTLALCASEGSPMHATVIYDDRVASISEAEARGDDFWIPLAAVREATGWELKPQGLCRGERCVPIPPGRRDEFLRGDSDVNLAALARQLGQPVLHDDSHAIWFFGDCAEDRRAALSSLQAPDFRLPDLDGRMHSLSDFRGRKVLLLSWASW